jgi:hypothetical protein
MTSALGLLVSNLKTEFSRTCLERCSGEDERHFDQNADYGQELGRCGRSCAAGTRATMEMKG